MTEDIKKGLMGIVVDETTISQVMPEINSLTYRGYKEQRDFPVEVIEVKWNEERNEYEY